MKQAIEQFCIQLSDVAKKYAVGESQDKMQEENRQRSQKEYRESFSRLVHTLSRFSLKLSEVWNFCEKHDEVEIDSHINIACMVTKDNDLWNQFIKEARESEVITNQAVFIIFIKFAHEKKLNDKNYLKNAVERKNNKSKRKSFTFSAIERAKSESDPRKHPKEKQNSCSKLKTLKEMLSFDADETLHRRHSCSTLSSYNEDIYVPEEDSKINVWLAKLHDIKGRHSSSHLENFIKNQGK